MNDILKEANELYANLGGTREGGRIVSNQLKAIATVMVNKINEELDVMKRKIIALEKEVYAEN